jgi:hypothetical protein
MNIYLECINIVDVYNYLLRRSILFLLLMWCCTSLFCTEWTEAVD